MVKRSLRWRIGATVLLILILTLILLVVTAPEVFICQPIVFRMLRFIPDGCLRWRTQ